MFKKKKIIKLLNNHFQFLHSLSHLIFLKHYIFVMLCLNYFFLMNLNDVFEPNYCYVLKKKEIK